jgi:hypothetical protein
MKVLLLRLSVFAVICIIVFSISSLFDTPSINIKNCNPDGPISKIKRAYDPLLFAVKQHTALEDYYSQGVLEDSLYSCVHTYKDSKVEKERCERDALNYEKKVRECYIFWKNQCNINGGSCN